MEALPDILEKLENYAIHSSIDEEKGMEEYDVREQLRRQADVTLNLRGEIIREYITDYIKKNSKSRLTRNFIKKSRDYLYVEKKENEMGRLKRYDEKEHRFLGTDFIEAGWIRIKADEMGEEVREMIYTGDNSERMKLLCFWISDRKDEVKKMIGGELTKELYVRFLRILDFDKRGCDMKNIDEILNSCSDIEELITERIKYEDSLPCDSLEMPSGDSIGDKILAMKYFDGTI